MAKKKSIPEQVEEALDGRTQRWLALEIKMPETNLSKKMKQAPGYYFTEEDIKKINKRLNCNISL